MKAIVISEKRWEELWKNLQSKLDLIECTCKLNCTHVFPSENIRRKMQYEIIGLKQEIERSSAE